ncbi:protein downstream neighbor of Son-like [Senna tora]|uniref:Protein downstream neighbor of Son-like n=1 Tax=Senna tora TaxID=362788 RepID=A0A834W4U4_9FABA|nr:protein downstream neighbor of Son-like [Senna tora]
MENTTTSGEGSKDGILQSSHTIEKCSQGKFLSVTELSSSADRSLGSAAIDMGKALRGLVAPEPHVSHGLSANSFERHGDATSIISGNFVTECHVPGHNAPLDLTLKTSMRVVSSSMNWIHRSVTGSIVPQFPFQDSTFKGQNMSGHSHLTSNSLGFKVLHSWMYPQSILPSSLISVLSSSTADGVELEFLRKRQVAWEESFRDLYYMLRKNACAIFYVCTSQFVVMFTGSDGSDRSRSSCNAYISQSTRGLRSLLKEHDVCFSMPLSRSKVEQVATEDLVELSEIENHNLGQTRRLSSFSDVDNTPESLLAFSGNMNVHALYDLLLNYRSIFTSLSGMDVPVLCSPVPFQNAAVSSPDIKCMEMRRAEHIAASCEGSNWKDVELAQGSSDGICCSIEIRDTFLPPWIICGICSLMGSEGRNFEASFVTEPTSIGLNVALKSTCEKSESKATGGQSLQKRSDTFGIPGAAFTSCLWSCSIKGLKYSDDSYTVSLSPV